MIRRSLVLTIAVFAIGCLQLNPARGQGLIFNLPEDGSAVTYEGTMVQSTGPADESPLSWTCELSIKSVGREEAMVGDRTEMCRWIEFKTLTGKSGAAGIDPGPVGARIWKVLVPESRALTTATDSDGIPYDMLPIAKGFRRLGEEAVKEITSPALRTYPTITLLTNYQQIQELADNAVPETLLQGQSLTAKHLKGLARMERAESRSTNEGEYWVSDDVPFGLARWVVTVTREEKPSAAPIADFKVVNVVTMDMKLKSIRQNAESELVTQ
jgi:hypothetical protein